MITQPDADRWPVPGPLQLGDRTVWWTGRVVIGLMHVRRPAQAAQTPRPQVLCTTARQRLAMRCRQVARHCGELLRGWARP